MENVPGLARCTGKRCLRGNLFIGCECVFLAFVTVLSVFVRLTVRVEFSAA